MKIVKRTCYATWMIKHELISVGAILLLGLLGGWSAKKIRLPHISGYLLIGFLTGPYVLGLLSTKVMHETHIIIDIALGFILYAIGGQFDLLHLGKHRKIIILGFTQSFLTFLVIFFAVQFFDITTGLALLMAAIGAATSPAIVLLVVKDFNAQGPVTETTLMATAISNLVSFLLFSLVLGVIHIEKGQGFLLTVGQPLYSILGSAALGGIMGYLIAIAEKYLHEEEEMFLLVAGGLMMSVGLAITLNLSPLFVALMVGAVTKTVIRSHKFKVVDIDPMAKIFYIALFVYAGAEMDPTLFPNMGMICLFFILSRTFGIIAGTYICAVVLGMVPTVRKYAGIALVPMAGMAIGLTETTATYYPEIGSQLNVVILSSIFIFELVGPLLTEFAIIRAGEAEYKYPELPPEKPQVS